MSTLFLLRLLTWVMLVINWAVLVWLHQLLKRANRDCYEARNDANHWATLAIFTQMKLQEVAPGTPVGIPEDTARWMEAKALENMVYGDEE